MTKRLPVLDLAKAMSIIFMFFIHVYEVGYYDGDLIINGKTEFFFDSLVNFLGSVPSAFVFIFVMGFLVGWSDTKTPEKLLKESLTLTGLGFLVNIFQQLFPLLYEEEIIAELIEALPALLATDIYYFDALALVCLSAVIRFPKEKRVKVTVWMMVISLALSHGLNALVNPTGSVWLDTALGLFVRLNEYSYFPLFNWLPFVLLGYLIACFYKEKQNRFTMKDRVVSLALGTVLAVGSYIAMKKSGIDDVVCFGTQCEGDNYYNMLGFNALESLGILILLMNLYEGITYLLKGKLPEILTYMSANIADIYVIQWFLIGLSYNIIAGISNIYLNMLASLVILILAIVLTELKKRIFNRHTSK